MSAAICGAAGGGDRRCFTAFALRTFLTTMPAMEPNPVILPADPLREPAPLHVALIAWGLMILGWSGLADIAISWGFGLPQNVGGLVLALPLGIAVYRGDDLARKITLFLGFLIASLCIFGAVSECIGAVQNTGNPMAMAAAIAEMVTMIMTGALGITTGVLLRSDATMSWCRRQQRHTQFKGPRIVGLLLSAAAVAIVIHIPHGVQRKAWASAYTIAVDIIPVDQVTNAGLRQGSMPIARRSHVDRDLPSLRLTTSASPDGLTFQIRGIAIKPQAFELHADGYASQTITIDNQTPSRLVVPMARTADKP